MSIFDKPVNKELLELFEKHISYRLDRLVPTAPHTKRSVSDMSKPPAVFMLRHNLPDEEDMSEDDVSKPLFHTLPGTRVKGPYSY